LIQQWRNKIVGYKQYLNALLVVASAWAVINWAEINSNIRYDKYPTYIDWYRFSLLLVVVGGGAYLFHRLVIPLGIGILLPSNPFFALFVLLVLAGVLITSNYGVIGGTSCYGCMAAFALYFAG